MTFIFWCTTAPISVGLMATLSGSPRDEMPGLGLTLLCLVAGSVGAFMENSAAYAALQAVAVLAELAVLALMVAFTRRGLAAATTPITYRLWLLAGCVAAERAGQRCRGGPKSQFNSSHACIFRSCPCDPLS